MQNGIFVGVFLYTPWRSAISHNLASSVSQCTDSSTHSNKQKQMLCVHVHTCMHANARTHNVCIITVATCNAETYRLLYVFCGSCRQQNRRSLAADISKRGRQNGTKFYRWQEGGWCTPPSRPVTFGPEGFPGEPKY